MTAVFGAAVETSSPSNRYKEDQIFLLALYHGAEKPSANWLLEELVSELVQLGTVGMRENRSKVSQQYDSFCSFQQRRCAWRMRKTSGFSYSSIPL